MVERVYVGHFMTSLDMAGFSLTLARLGQQQQQQQQEQGGGSEHAAPGPDPAVRLQLELLDMAVGAPGWPGMCVAVRPRAMHEALQPMPGGRVKTLRHTP